MPRTYHPYVEKHKWPKGYGSLCPKMQPSECEQLLSRALQVEGVGLNKLWVASGRWCFCAHPSPSAGSDAWHGFPVIGGDVDERVWTVLVTAGIITQREANRLR